MKTVRASLRDLAGARDLLFEFVRRDLRIRYKQAVMGFLWAFFMPTLVVLSGVIVRLVLARFGATEPLDGPVIGGLALKAVPWGFAVGGIQFMTSSLVNNQTLVSKVYFPREVLPTAALLAQGFDSGVALLAVLALLPFLGMSLGVQLLWLPVLLALLFLLVLGAGLALSCANIFFRDVRYLVQVILTFGIFFTPVFYDSPMLGDTGAMLSMLNPVAPILEGLRLAVIEGHNLLLPLEVASAGETVVAWRPWYLAWSAGCAVAGYLMATRLFRSSVDAFAEYV